jgi:hypothetical protein
MWIVWALYAVSFAVSGCFLAGIGPTVPLLVVGWGAIAVAVVQLTRIRLRP